MDKGAHEKKRKEKSGWASHREGETMRSAFSPLGGRKREEFEKVNTSIAS